VILSLISGQIEPVAWSGPDTILNFEDCERC
jgi:hypothetical protein